RAIGSSCIKHSFVTSSHAAKLPHVPDHSVPRAGRPGLQFRNQENFVRNGKFAVKSQLPSRFETESRVVIGMPDHEHKVIPNLPARLKSFADQLRADTASLILRQDSHRREAERGEGAPIRLDSNGAEENVTDDLLIPESDKRYIRICIRPQRLNEIG